MAPLLKYMRKPDGKTEYTDDVHKVLSDALYLNRLFLIDSEDNWVMDLERCKLHQAKFTEEPAIGFEKCKAPSVTQIMFHYEQLKRGEHLNEADKQRLEDKSGLR